MPGGPWYCWWSLILAPHRWGWIMILGGWTTGQLFCDLLCLLSWLGVWNDSSHLIGRYHVLRVKVIYPVYNGLERSVFFRAILNSLERTLFMHVWRLYGLRGFRFTFDTFGGWSWKDTFTWLFLSMEVTSSQMVLKGVCWWFRFAPLPSPWGFAVYSQSMVLKGCSWCCFLSFSQ